MKHPELLELQIIASENTWVYHHWITCKSNPNISVIGSHILFLIKHDKTRVKYLIQLIHKLQIESRT